MVQEADEGAWYLLLKCPPENCSSLYTPAECDVFPQMLGIIIYLFIFTIYIYYNFSFTYITNDRNVSILGKNFFFFFIDV